MIADECPGGAVSVVKGPQIWHCGCFVDGPSSAVEDGVDVLDSAILWV